MSATRLTKTAVEYFLQNRNYYAQGMAVNLLILRLRYRYCLVALVYDLVVEYLQITDIGYEDRG